ncbi:MAG: HlyD family efflux transporter periplasmic adaptor subunit [Cytophagales bacterium]|nr:HlyD family efflux transporter periplasmic adaptor subunit [Cytophagales bacterium]
MLALLPIISLDVTVSTFGLIGTNEQRHILSTTVGGRILDFSIFENSRVNKGDTLLQLDPLAIQEESDQIKSRLLEIGDFLKDLELLIENPSTPQKKMTSSTYQLASLQFHNQLKNLILEKENTNRVYIRQKKLFESQVIAAVDFENDEAKLRRSESEISIFRSQSVNEWKTAVLLFEKEERDLKLRESRLAKELPQYVLLSPVEGEIQNTSSLVAGQYIQGGLKLGEISPQRALIATCWVTPGNIGSLRKGMTGNFRIDTSNANQWGMISGMISEISSDVYVINNQPMFKVNCELDQQSLTLDNGFVGHLKKGMTFQSNFTITNRTLYQLLFDKVDDWLNPQTSGR